VGASGLVLPYQALNADASRNPDAGTTYSVLKAPGWYGWKPGLAPGWGERQNGLTCGEILPAHDYWHMGKHWCGLLLGLVLFSLVVPPLQPRVVGPNPVQGV
jgi:hypothetical protein